MNPRRLSPLLPLALTVPLLIARPVHAHVYENYESVHFNSGQPDFGLPPRRASLWNDEQDDRPMAMQGMSSYNNSKLAEFGGDSEDNRDAHREKREKALRASARAAEDRGDWRAARQFYIQCATDDDWTGDLRDRVAVLGEQIHAARPVTRGEMQRYLRAMDAVNDSYAEQWTGAHETFLNIASDPHADFLRPYARYQAASIQAGWFDYRNAIAGYQSLLHDFPHAAIREDALLMLARCAILPATDTGQNLPVGVAALRTLRAEFPQTRFTDSIDGLSARVDFLNGRLVPAIDAYFRLEDTASIEAVLKRWKAKEREPYYPRLLCLYLSKLNEAEDFNHYARAVESVRDTIAVLTPTGARTFVAQMRHDPAGIAAPYFYYRLYHCDNTSRDLRQLVRLADTFISRANSLPPLLRVRMAEVFYQADRMTDALRWAQAANAGTKPYDRALYIEGAALHRLHQLPAARTAFETLLTRCPDSHLRYPAHENLAILDEDLGDLSSALDHYFALDYQADIAFFLDARLTTAQVAAYIASHPHHPQHDLLVYSLGMRYLRDENWNAARRALTSISHKSYVNLWQPDKDDKHWGWMDDTPQPSPLKTLADLSRLKHAAAIAPNRAARASALFHYASYYYNGGTLLLYNYALWGGTREANFDFCWNGRLATVEDGRATRRHMYQHETYARTQAICERLARDFPDTPTAPYALYRAGCCASKLAGFNGWWRDDNDRQDHMQEAATLMRRLARDYPHHPLAHEARKFAHVFQTDADAAAKERIDEKKEAAKNPSSWDARNDKNEDL